jgi:hypothetical protein
MSSWSGTYFISTGTIVPLHILLLRLCLVKVFLFSSSKGEPKLLMFKNKVLRKIFENMKDDVRGN